MSSVGSYSTQTTNSSFANQTSSSVISVRNPLMSLTQQTYSRSPTSPTSRDAIDILNNQFPVPAMSQRLYKATNFRISNCKLIKHLLGPRLYEQCLTDIIAIEKRRPVGVNDLHVLAASKSKQSITFGIQWSFDESIYKQFSRIQRNNQLHIADMPGPYNVEEFNKLKFYDAASLLVYQFEEYNEQVKNKPQPLGSIRVHIDDSFTRNSKLKYSRKYDRERIEALAISIAGDDLAMFERKHQANKLDKYNYKPITNKNNNSNNNSNNNNSNINNNNLDSNNTKTKTKIKDNKKASPAPTKTKATDGIQSSGGCSQLKEYLSDDEEEADDESEQDSYHGSNEAESDSNDDSNSIGGNGGGGSDVEDTGTPTIKKVKLNDGSTKRIKGKEYMLNGVDEPIKRDMIVCKYIDT